MDVLAYVLATIATAVLLCPRGRGRPRAMTLRGLASVAVCAFGPFAPLVLAAPGEEGSALATGLFVAMPAWPTGIVVAVITAFHAREWRKEGREASPPPT